MEKNDILWSLTQHLESKFSAKSSVLSFVNYKRNPLFIIKLPELTGVIMFEVDEIQYIYDESGYTRLCEITDDSIEMFRKQFGGF